MSALDIMIRLLTTGQSEAKSAMDAVGNSAGDLDKKLGEVGENEGLEQVGEKAKTAGSGLDEAAQKAQALQGQLNTVRNVAMGLAVVGAGGMALSHELAQVYNEAEGANQKLNAMLAKRGEGGRLQEMDEWASKLSKDAALVDDEGIKKAGAGLLGFGVNANQIKELMPGLIGQSRLYGESLESVSEQFGKAFASGNAGMLKRAGVTLSQEDLDYIAKATTEVEQQGRLFERVKKSMDNYALGMTQGMSATEIASNRAKNEIHDAEVAVGKGAAEAQANLQGMTAHIVALVSHNPKLAEGAGEILTYGSSALASIGGAAAFAAQIGSTIIQFQLLSLARQKNAAAAVTDAAASTEAGAAALASGAEAEAGSLGHDALAVSEGAAALAAEGEAVAVGVGGAAAVAGGAGAGAGAGALGFGALALAIWAACAPLLVFVAIAGAAALAMYGLNKAMHSGEDEALQKNIDAGNATNQARLDAANKERKRRGQSEITVEQWQKMESDDDSATTPEDASKPKGWNSGGDGSGAPASGGAPDMAQLQTMLANSKPGAAPQMGANAAPASMPNAPTNVPINTPTGAGDGAFGIEAGAAFAPTVGAGLTKYGEKQREQQEKKLEHEAKTAKTKAERDEKHAQLAALRAQTQTARDEKHAQLLATHEQKAEDKDAVAIRKAQIDNEREDKIADLEDQLDKARENRDGERVRSLTEQIEHEKGKAKYDEAMYSASMEQDPKHRAALEQIAGINLQADARRETRAGDKAAESVEREGKRGGGKGNAALESYLRGGGDVNQWKKDGQKTGEGGSDARSGGGSGSRETQVSVPMPTPRQTPLDGGRIQLTFVAPPPIVIENPLARHLEEF